VSLRQITPCITEQSYSFDADRVTLRANVLFSEEDLSHSSEWYLQLRACSNDEKDDSEGVKVAQIQTFFEVIVK
jgi:hypothetical protein